MNKFYYKCRHDGFHEDLGIFSNVDKVLKAMYKEFFFLFQYLIFGC